MVSGKPNRIRFFRLSLRRGGPGVVSLRVRQFAFDVRRGAGVVERGGLENRCALTRTEGSNPSLSAIPLTANAPIWCLDDCFGGLSSIRAWFVYA